MIEIKIEEIDNGFILTLFDDKAPSDTDATIFIKTMIETLDQIGVYYEKILAWRKTEEAEE